MAVGAAAPAFAAPDLAGDTVSLADLRGAPVLVNLWATWCHPCRAEMPYLQSLQERLGPQGLEMVGVSLDIRAARRDVDGFLEEFGVTYRNLLDPGGVSLETFGAVGLPASYLIASDGTLLWFQVGPIEEGDHAFEEALEEALSGRGSGA